VKQFQIICALARILIFGRFELMMVKMIGECRFSSIELKWDFHQMEVFIDCSGELTRSLVSRDI
jgi:hypothetical protein